MDLSSTTETASERGSATVSVRLPKGEASGSLQNGKSVSCKLSLEPNSHRAAVCSVSHIDPVTADFGHFDGSVSHASCPSPAQLRLVLGAGCEYEGAGSRMAPCGKGVLRLRSEGGDGASLVFSGEWLEGQRHGKGVVELSNGTSSDLAATFEGDWSRDYRNGVGTLRYSVRRPDPTPCTVTGLWRNGRVEGDAVLSLDGKPKYRAKFDASEPTQHATFYFSTGEFCGSWSSPVRRVIERLQTMSTCESVSRVPESIAACLQTCAERVRAILRAERFESSLEEYNAAARLVVTALCTRARAAYTVTPLLLLDAMQRNLEEQNEGSSKGTAAKQKELASHQGKLQECSNQLQLIEKDALASRSKLTSAQKALDAENAELTTLRADSQQDSGGSASMQEMEALKTSLHAQVGRVRNELADLRTLQKNTKKAIEGAKADVESLRTDIERLRSHVTNCESSLQSSEGKLSSQASEYKALVEEAESSKRRVQDEVDHLREIAEALNRQRKTAEGQLEELKRASLATSLQPVAVQKDELERQIHDMEGALTIAAREEGQLNDALIELEANRKALEVERTQLESGALKLQSEAARFASISDHAQRRIQLSRRVRARRRNSYFRHRQRLPPASGGNEVPL